MSEIGDIFLRKKEQGQRLAALTAYDYVFGRLLDDMGLDFLLVGDSVGMVQMGLPDTTGVTIEHMEHHLRCVVRAARKTPVFADLPAICGRGVEGLMEGAKRLMGAGAVAVKLEGGVERELEVRRLVGEGIPFVGHLGMLPQRVREEGGYRVKGRTREEARKLFEDAEFLERAGAVAVVLELVEPEVAAEICSRHRIPFIGIGSGLGCDGQILVSYDLLGLMPWFRPSFVVPEAELGVEVRRAVGAFIERTRG